MNILTDNRGLQMLNVYTLGMGYTCHSVTVLFPPSFHPPVANSVLVPMCIEHIEVLKVGPQQ
jgi:hypothetical protein